MMGSWDGVIREGKWDGAATLMYKYGHGLVTSGSVFHQSTDHNNQALNWLSSQFSSTTTLLQQPFLHNTSKMPIPFPILPMSYPQRFTPSRKFTAFTHSRKTLDAVQVEAVFTQLNPVNPDLLIQGGEWHGIIMDTGHPFAEQLAHLQWRGAVFHSAEDVEPIVVDRDDKGEKATGVTDFGHASVCSSLVSVALNDANDTSSIAWNTTTSSPPP